MMNKRSFMVSAASACATLALPPMLAHAGEPATETAHDLQSWQDCLAQRFTLAGKSQTLTLVDVRVREAQRSGRRTEQFALHFAPAKGVDVAAGLHTLRHADGRQATLYLAAGQQHLVAEFNLL